jgi:phosphatidylglycerol---prolipoprotein diacylglyceryl transferase
MIPYFTIPSIKLGPITIEAFGIFAALGIYMASHLLVVAARKRRLPPQILADYALWGVLGGVVMGHLVHLLAYHPEELNKSPYQILRVWDGLSSFGGLLGGIVAAVVYFRVKRVSFRSYADCFALGVAPGWAIARVGCFVVHDHPGVMTSFPLAVNFPANIYRGGPRHDLGLYDALWLGVITLVLYLLAKRGLLTGRLLALMALMYAPARFLFDFLRAQDLSYVDARYLGLTPAQYGCMLIFGYGIYEMFIRKPTAVVAPVKRKLDPAA